MKVYFVVIFLSLASLNSWAATYYVSKSGSNNNSCTQAQSSGSPKLTIDDALACIGTAAGAGAGHTVEVADGTYVEAIVNSLPRGTSSNWFVLKAKNDRMVTIRPSSGPGAIYHSNSGVQYSIVSGFVLDGINLTSGSVITIFSSPSFMRFENNEIKNAAICGAPGTGVSNSLVYLDNGTNIEFLDNEIHHGLCGHGIYIEGSGNLVRGNEIYDLNRYGIHNYSSIPGRYPSNNVYDSNWVHHTGMSDAITAFPILLSTGDNNRASNNLVTNNQEGINSSTGKGNLVYNNTLYGNGIGHGGECCYGAIRLQDSVNTVVKNNILFGNQINSIETTGSTGAIISNNLLVDPRFVSPTNNNFHLQSGSPAIDAGVTISGITTDLDGARRPQGSAFDIGAYEYGGVVPLPTPTPLPNPTPIPTQTPTPTPTPIVQTSAASISAKLALVAPVIDGVLLDGVWAQANSVKFSDPARSDNQITVSILWDSNNLYFAYWVSDSSLETTDLAGNLWQDDGPEIFLDTLRNGGSAMDANDYHLMGNIHDLVEMYQQDQNMVSGVIIKTATVPGGYTQEVSIPWSTLNMMPGAGKILGLLLGSNDRDNGSVAQLDWQQGLNSTSAYNQPSLWGSLTLSSQSVGTPLPSPTPMPTPTIAPTPTPTPPVTVSTDIVAPTVAITAPTSATVARRSDVTITANASDNFGVTRVEFYVNGTLKCTDSSAAYTCAWKVPRQSGRTYQLKAKAYDAAGNVGTHKR